MTARRAAPEVRSETKRPRSDRPLPYPAPVGLNDNSYNDAGEGGYAPRAPRRRLTMVQLLARIFIAPLYLLVAIGAVAIIALFARGFLA